MPAPLAKGLIIAASVLVAAGVAVYENPQVREWVEKSRQRIALALYNLGDEIHPASSNDDAANAAVEAARRKRDEIMATNRERFLRRHSSKPGPVKGSSSSADRQTSFDDFLKRDDEETYSLQKSGVEVGPPQSLRKRGESSRAEEGATAPSNIVDSQEQGEVLFDQNSLNAEKDVVHDNDRESTVTLGGSDAQHTPRLAPATEPLVDLSTSQHPLISPADTTSQPQATTQSPFDDYFSTNEWADRDASSSNSTAESREADSRPETPQQASPRRALSPSLESMHSFSSAGPTSVHTPNQSGAASPSTSFDVLSDDEGDGLSVQGIQTPSSWTDVGSEISDDDVGGPT